MNEIILEAEDFLSSRLDPRFHDEAQYKLAKEELLQLLYRAKEEWMAEMNENWNKH